jgi:hypothetical protein
MKLISAIFFIALLISIQGAYAQKSLYFEFAPGISLVPPLPLKISLEDEKIELWAHYKTRSFDLPFYYSIRAGISGEKSGWEVELNHHKVYLKNKPEAIERFSISHGYNHLLVSRTRKLAKLSDRIGIGVVIAHPESIIYGKQLNETKGLFNDGYYLAGPAAVYGVYKVLDINRFLQISFTAFGTAAWAWVKVAEGHASVPMVALHLQIAPGIKVPLR